MSLAFPALPPAGAGCPHKEESEGARPRIIRTVPMVASLFAT